MSEENTAGTVILSSHTSDSLNLVDGMIATGEDGVTYQVVVQNGSSTEFMLLEEGEAELETMEEEAADEVEGMEDQGGEEVCVKKEIAVQANDYEIERRSGKLPARQRFVPYKFRDFENPDDAIEQASKDDEDYRPETAGVKKLVRIQPGASKKKRGRPRKAPVVEHSYDSGKSMSTVNEELLKKAEESYQVAASIDYLYVCNHGDCKEVKFKSHYLYKKHIQGIHKEVSLRTKGRPPKGGEAASRLFTCLICNKMFSQKGNLKIHMGIHTGAKPYHCDHSDCSQVFRTQDGLDKHMKTHDELHNQFVCETCNKKFSSKTALKEHVTLHTGELLYQCRHCEKRFRQSSSLYRHNLLHIGEKKFKCEVCAKAFCEAMHLKVHMRTHTGEKPYQCKTCQKRFTYQSDVVRHQNVHFGQKKFVCGICDARFSDPSSRRRHLKEHISTKDYECQLCGEAFKRAGQLKAHLSKKHSHQKDDILILRSGRFKALQFYFRHSNGDHFVALTDEDGNVVGEDVPEIEQQSDQQVQQQQETIVLSGENLHVETEPESVEISTDTQNILHQIQAKLSTQQGNGQQPVQVAYHILHEDENQQIVEVEYQDQKEIPTSSTEIQHVINQASTSKSSLLSQMNSASSSSLFHKDGQGKVVEEFSTASGESVQIIEAQVNSTIDANVQSGGVGDSVEARVVNDDQRGIKSKQVTQDKNPGFVESSGNLPLLPLQKMTRYTLKCGQDGSAHKVVVTKQEPDEQEQVIMQTFPADNRSIEAAAEGIAKLEKVREMSAVVEGQEVPYQDQSDQVQGQQVHVQKLHMISESDIAQSRGQHHKLNVVGPGQRIEGQEVQIIGDLQGENIQIIGQDQGVQYLDQAQTFQGPQNNVIFEGQVIQGQGESGVLQDVQRQYEETEQSVDNSDLVGQHDNSMDKTLESVEAEQNDWSVLSSDFIHNPDFSCQEYYNWLSLFTDQCKLLELPLEKTTFESISFVHKTLSDVLAAPTGILSNKNNFLILKNLAHDLYEISNHHLLVVMETLEG